MLLVEDSASDARMLATLIPDDLRDQVSIMHARTLAEAEPLAPRADLIVVDSGLPDARGAEAAVRLQILARLAEVVMWTGFYSPCDVDAFAATPGPAGSVLIKGGRRDQASAVLRGAIRRAIEREPLRHDVVQSLRRALSR